MNMKIYFIASLYGKEKYSDNYKKIVTLLEDMGHTVISEQVLNKSASDLKEQSDDERVGYYKQMLSWIGESDLVIAEITSPSSSVGHEVTVALDKDKPVIALSYKGVAPNIFRGISSDKFQLLSYEGVGDKFIRELKKAIKKAQKTIDIRFNFFISPEIGRYLDWVAKYKRTPRSVYLREIIEKDMENDEEYANFSQK
jgi:predicted DNA-binding protein